MINISDPHFGVYGLIIQNGKVLTVRKNRGPYQGLLCLPGGTPMINETDHDTLKREIKEETGADIKSIGEFFKFDLHVNKDSFDKPISFRHSGYWALITVQGIDLNIKDAEDVESLQWIDLDNWELRKDLSLPLRTVFKNV